MTQAEIYAVDLFCGAGGLSRGFLDAGIAVAAGVDVDPDCKYPFERNIKAPFIQKSVSDLTGAEVRRLFPPNAISLLAGCAPCQPFSKLRIGRNTTKEVEWSLLDDFGRLVRGATPDLVTMENVPGLQSKVVFRRFLRTLAELEYQVHWLSVRCAKLGIPQTRRRLVLIASRIGAIAVPAGRLGPSQFRTVRQTIGRLPAIAHGETYARDALHTSQRLEELNLERIRAAIPGGTWRDWPLELRAPCHNRSTGASFQSVYARMEWDNPSPTITTQAFNFGTGRFGHPEQDRAISLREAAMLQTFPRAYQFVQPGAEFSFKDLGKLIGNAVPPLLGYHIGHAMMEAIAAG